MSLGENCCAGNSWTGGGRVSGNLCVYVCCVSRRKHEGTPRSGSWVGWGLDGSDTPVLAVIICVSTVNICLMAVVVCVLGAWGGALEECLCVRAGGEQVGDCLQVCRRGRQMSDGSVGNT